MAIRAAAVTQRALAAAVTQRQPLRAKAPLSEVLGSIVLVVAAETPRPAVVVVVVPVAETPRPAVVVVAVVQRATKT